MPKKRKSWWELQGDLWSAGDGCWYFDALCLNVHVLKIGPWYNASQKWWYGRRTCWKMSSDEYMKEIIWWTEKLETASMKDSMKWRNYQKGHPAQTSYNGPSTQGTELPNLLPALSSFLSWKTFLSFPRNYLWFNPCPSTPRPFQPLGSSNLERAMGFCWTQIHL